MKTTEVTRQLSPPTLAMEFSRRLTLSTSGSLLKLTAEGAKDLLRFGPSPEANSSGPYSSGLVVKHVQLCG